MSANPVFVGMDLGSFKTSVASSAGYRDALQTAVGWPKDHVARTMLGRDIVGPKRFLQPASIELSERLGAAQSRSRVPDTAGVDQQSGVVANATARAADQFDVQRFALTHWFPAELDGLVTGLKPTLADFPGLIAIPAEENGGIGLDPVMMFSAQQAMDRLVEVFPLEIPERHVKGAHRADRD